MAFLFIQKNDFIKGLKRLVALSLIFCFICEQAGFAQVAGPQPPAFAGSLANDKCRPLHLRSIDFDRAARSFDILLDKGDVKPKKPVDLEQAARDAITYFFIGMRLPNSSFWVNLRPDSPERIIDDCLEKTDIGRILLAADVQLKKDLARYTSPRTKEGRQYWDRLYKKAEELFGNEDISIPTVTRPWIVPDEIILRDAGTSAYIYKATLKVLLESDYLKDTAAVQFEDSRFTALNDYSSQIIKELILPKLSRDVNISKRYASLRQVYYSLILAQWFKSRNSGSANYGIDQKDLRGLTSKAAWSKDTYFKQYQESFSKGEYNIQDVVQTPCGQTIKQYFSGGIQISQLAPVSIVQDPASMPDILSITADSTVRLADTAGSQRVTVVTGVNGFDMRFTARDPLMAHDGGEETQEGMPSYEEIKQLFRDKFKGYGWSEFEAYLDSVKGSSGRPGQGYHSYEHGIEVAYLSYLAGKNKFDMRELLELVVAAALHDLDKRPALFPPKVSNTLNLLETDESLRKVLAELGLDINRVSLLIQHTAYPWTQADEDFFKAGLRDYGVIGEHFHRSFTDKAKFLQLIDKLAPYACLDSRGLENRIKGLYEETGVRMDSRAFAKTAEFLESLKKDLFFEYVMSVLPEWARNNWKRNRAYFIRQSNAPETEKNAAWSDKFQQAKDALYRAKFILSMTTAGVNKRLINDFLDGSRSLSREQGRIYTDELMLLAHALKSVGCRSSQIRNALDRFRMTYGWEKRDVDEYIDLSRAIRETVSIMMANGIHKVSYYDQNCAAVIASSLTFTFNRHHDLAAHFNSLIPVMVQKKIEPEYTGRILFLLTQSQSGWTGENFSEPGAYAGFARVVSMVKDIDGIGAQDKKENMLINICATRSGIIIAENILTQALMQRCTPTTIANMLNEVFYRKSLPGEEWISGLTQQERARRFAANVNAVQKSKGYEFTPYVLGARDEQNKKLYRALAGDDVMAFEDTLSRDEVDEKTLGHFLIAFCTIEYLKPLYGKITALSRQMNAGGFSSQQILSVLSVLFAQGDGTAAALQRFKDLAPLLDAQARKNSEFIGNCLNANKFSERFYRDLVLNRGSLTKVIINALSPKAFDEESNDYKKYMIMCIHLYRDDYFPDQMQFDALWKEFYFSNADSDVKYIVGDVIAFTAMSQTGGIALPRELETIISGPGYAGLSDRNSAHLLAAYIKGGADLPRKYFKGNVGFEIYCDIVKTLGGFEAADKLLTVIKRLIQAEVPDRDTAYIANAVMRQQSGYAFFSLDFLYSEQNHVLLKEKASVIYEFMSQGYSSNIPRHVIDFEQNSVNHKGKLEFYRNMLTVLRKEEMVKADSIEDWQMFLNDYLNRFGYLINRDFILMHRLLTANVPINDGRLKEYKLRDMGITVSGKEGVEQLSRIVARVRSDIIKERQLDETYLRNPVVEAMVSGMVSFYSGWGQVAQRGSNLGDFVEEFNRARNRGKIPDLKKPFQRETDFKVHIKQVKSEFAQETATLFSYYKRLISQAGNLSEDKDPEKQLSDVKGRFIRALDEHAAKLTQSLGETRENRKKEFIQKELVLVSRLKAEISNAKDMLELSAMAVKKLLSRAAIVRDQVVVALTAHTFSKYPNLKNEALRDINKGLSISSLDRIIEIKEVFIKDHILAGQEKSVRRLILKDILNVEQFKKEIKNEELKNDAITVHAFATKGIFGELAGYIGNACYTSQKLIMSNKHITAVLFTTGEGLDTSFVGSMLILENSYNGRDLLILRAINPAESFLQEYSTADFLKGAIGYVSDIAKAHNDALMATPIHATGALTNRHDYIDKAINKFAKSYDPIKLDRKENFNNIDITNACVLLSPEEADQPQKDGGAFDKESQTGAPGREGLSTVEDKFPSSGAPVSFINDGGDDAVSGYHAAGIKAAADKTETFSYKFSGAPYESLDPIAWEKQGWDFIVSSVDYVRSHVPFEYIPRSKMIPAKIEFIITEMLENAYDAVASRCDSKYLADNDIVPEKDRDGYITAGFSAENSYLVFTVYDNGMGRNAASTRRKQKLQGTLYLGGEGLAMEKLQEISAQINGKFELVFDNGLTRAMFYFPIEYIRLKSDPVSQEQGDKHYRVAFHGETDGGILSDGQIRALFKENGMNPAPDRELIDLIKKAAEYFEVSDLGYFIKGMEKFCKRPVTVISDDGTRKKVSWFELRRALVRLPQYARTARQAGLEYDESFYLLSRAVALLRYDFAQPCETIDALIYAVSGADKAGVDWDRALPALHDLMDFCGESDVIDQSLVCFGRGLEIGFSVEGICRTIRKLPDEDGTLSGHVFPSFIEALGSIRPARVDPALLERAFDILAGDRPYYHNKYNSFIAFLYGSVSQDMLTPREVLQKIVAAANDREGIFALEDGQNNNIRQTISLRERLWLDMGNSSLVNRLLPYKTIRSWEEGMADLAGLMQVRDNTIEGIDIREGAWLFAPETQTWYSIGGKTQEQIGRVRHIIFPCDVSRLSSNPAFVHIHPESLEILIGPLPQQLEYPGFHKKITKLSSSVPSGADFAAIAALIRRDSSHQSNMSAYIVHSLGITEIVFPDDPDAIEKLAGGFRDLKDRVLLDFDVAKYSAQYGDSETSFDFVRRFFPVINSRLPAGFAIFLHGFESMPPEPSHGETRNDGGEEEGAPLTIEDYRADIAAASQRGDIIRYSAGESVDEFSPEEGLKTTNSRGLRREGEDEFEEGQGHEDGWIILNTLLDNIPAGSGLSVLEIGPGFGRTCYDMYRQIKNRNAAPHIETIGLTPIPARIALQRSAHWIRQRIADIVVSKKIDSIRGLREYLSGLKSFKARNPDELAIEDIGPVMHETRKLPLELVFALQEGGADIFKRLDEPFIAQQHIARLDEIALDRQFDFIYDQWGGFYYSVFGTNYLALQAALERILPMLSEKGVFFAAVLPESLMQRLKYVMVPAGFTVMFFGPRNGRRMLAVRQGSIYEQMLRPSLSPSKRLGDIYMIDGLQDFASVDAGAGKDPEISLTDGGNTRYRGDYYEMFCNELHKAYPEIPEAEYLHEFEEWMLWNYKCIIPEPDDEKTKVIADMLHKPPQPGSLGDMELYVILQQIFGVRAFTQMKWDWALFGYFGSKEYPKILHNILDPEARKSIKQDRRILRLYHKAGAQYYRRLVNIEISLADELSGRFAKRPEAIRKLIKDIHAGDIPVFDPVLNSLLGVKDYELEQEFKQDIESVAAYRTEEYAYRGTPYELIIKILKHVRLKPSDVLIDLGSGYGRMAMYAALTTPVKKAIGIELVSERVSAARESARKLGLANVEFRNNHIKDSDLGEGTVFYLFDPFNPDTFALAMDRLHEIAKARKITMVFLQCDDAALSRCAWMKRVTAVPYRSYTAYVYESDCIEAVRDAGDTVRPDGGSEPLTFSRYIDDITRGINNGTIEIAGRFKDRFSALQFGIDPTNTRPLSAYGMQVLNYVLSGQAPAESARILVLGPGIGRECADMKDRALAMKKSVMIDTISLNPISPYIRLVGGSGEILTIMKTELLSGRIRQFLSSRSAYSLNVLPLEALFELHRLGYRIFENSEEPFIDHQTVMPFLEAKHLKAYDLVYDNCGGFFYTAQQNGMETALKKLIPFLKDEGIFYTEGLPWADFSDHDGRIPEGWIVVIDREKESFILLRPASVAGRRIMQYLNKPDAAHDNVFFVEHLGEVLYELQAMIHDGGAETKEVAGIDLRALHAARSPSGDAALCAPHAPPARLANRILVYLGRETSMSAADSRQEWLRIEQAIDSGAIPDTSALEAYIRQCCQSERIDAERDKVLLALAAILRLQEDLYIPTEPRLKELLVLLDSPA